MKIFNLLLVPLIFMTDSNGNFANYPFERANTKIGITKELARKLPQEYSTIGDIEKRGYWMIQKAAC